MMECVWLDGTPVQVDKSDLRSMLSDKKLVCLFRGSVIASV